MPQKRGRILSRRQISLTKAASHADGRRRSPTKFVGKLKPLGGGDPITYSSSVRINVGDTVRYTGSKRASVVKGDSLRTIKT
jgi:hypothetical protein